MTIQSKSFEIAMLRQPDHGARSDEQPLYAPSRKVHPRGVSGRNRRIKTIVAVVLVLFTALVPWIRWDRGPGLPDQAVLFSFTDMRAYLFGSEIWAQEFYYLTALLIVAALALFLATALYGRIWCGFACPQTVWTDLFVGIERLVEGDRNARIRLDSQAWSLGKVTRKAVKHAAWVGVAGLTGFIFVAYFTDAPQALSALSHGRASATLYGFWGSFAAMTYVMAGLAREQVCIYMCPWPRIQGGMLDEQSVVVGYDAGRGERRGHAKAGQSFDGRGHCVDCSICVQVCPTGIDIRNGPQLECINCGLCVDACQSVMAHFGLPRDLVGWRSLVPERTRAVRPRTVIYAGLIAATVIGSGVAFWFRATLDLAVLPDRAPTFVRLSDGAVRVGYTIRVINRDHHPVRGQLRVVGMDGATLTLLGDPSGVLTVGPDEVATVRVFVRQLPERVHEGVTPVRFVLHDDQSDREASAKSSFVAGDPLR